MRLLRHVASPAAVLTAVVLTAGLLHGSATASPPKHSRGGSTAAAAALAADKRVVVVAVGDIACAPKATRTPTTCQQRRTANLAAALDPDAVLALGDLQYSDGLLGDFRQSYAKSWGRLRGITHPIPGNHEYNTPGARGYYRYFKGRQPGAPGYYAVDLRRWRVYALNTNCDEINCRPQYRWLKKDLADNPRACSLFAMHHPRFSSGGSHGNDAGMTRFFRIAQNHRVEMVLAGHDHHYERFRRLLANGERSRRGVVSFISGAGGKSLIGLGRGVVKGSAYRRTGHFGVLRLALRPHAYRFAFKGIDGSTRDNGKRACR